MIRVIGGAGEVFVEYQLAVTLGAWSLSFNPAVALCDRQGSGTAKLISADPFWSHIPPTLLRLRVGPTWWSWKNVSVQLHPLTATITVVGDPDIGE